MGKLKEMEMSMMMQGCMALKPMTHTPIARVLIMITTTIVTFMTMTKKRK